MKNKFRYAVSRRARIERAVVRETAKLTNPKLAEKANKRLKELERALAK